MSEQPTLFGLPLVINTSMPPGPDLNLSGVETVHVRFTKSAGVFRMTFADGTWDIRPRSLARRLRRQNRPSKGWRRHVRRMKAQGA